MFMNNLFHFIKNAQSCSNSKYRRSVSAGSKEFKIVSQLLHTKAKYKFHWFCSNAMETNLSEFQGIAFKGKGTQSKVKFYEIRYKTCTWFRLVGNMTKHTCTLDRCNKYIQLMSSAFVFLI